MNIYEIVTNKIIEKLEQKIVPWRHYIKSPCSGKFPVNLITGKEYRGVNVWLLKCQQIHSNVWGSYKQWQSKGKQVKKEEKGSIVVFWSVFKKEGEEGSKDLNIPVLRYSTVFNESQIEGFSPPSENEKESINNPVDLAEGLIRSFPLEFPKAILSEDGRAFYRPSTDEIYMPSIQQCVDSQSWYSTYFHESIHATGHESRLKRFDFAESFLFGSNSYSKEELVAELGASYMNARCGLIDSQIENSVSYISHWLAKLRNDKKLIISASAQAQKACDFLLSREE